MPGPAPRTPPFASTATCAANWASATPQGWGLGPFIVNHPARVRPLDHRARDRAGPGPPHQGNDGGDVAARFSELLDRAAADVAAWRVVDPLQSKKIAALERDIAKIAHQLKAERQPGDGPWDALYRWGERTLTLEGQELLVSLLIEPHGDVVDDLADTMAADEEASFRIDGSMSIAGLCRIVEERYDWALKPNYRKAKQQARFWYVSANKLEPRLGERAEEPGAELELPLAIGRDVAALNTTARTWERDTPVADFLARHPEHRHAVRRCADRRSVPLR